jgi:hypothetical protein
MIGPRRLPLVEGATLLLLLAITTSIQAQTPVFRYLCNETSGSKIVKVSSIHRPVSVIYVDTLLSRCSDISIDRTIMHLRICVHLYIYI